MTENKPATGDPAQEKKPAADINPETPPPTDLAPESNSELKQAEKDPEPLAGAIEVQTTGKQAKKEPGRYTRATVFYPEENTYMERILEARKKSGLTKDWNQFLRQCVDYALNCKHFAGTEFATGEAKPQDFRNAFYKTK